MIRSWVTASSRRTTSTRTTSAAATCATRSRTQESRTARLLFSMQAAVYRCHNGRTSSVLPVMATDLQPFEAARPRLFGIAYRMLGSRSEAEDVVQEAYVRWHQAGRAEIRNPEAW